MPYGVWMVAAWIGFVFLFGIAAIGWGLHTGQFDDEEPKYRMLEDREPEPWPGRGTTAKEG